MALTKNEKNEVAYKLGSTVLKNLAEASRATFETAADPRAPEIQDLLNQVTAMPEAQVLIQVYRKPKIGREQYVGTIDTVDANTLKLFGVEHIVNDYSGGGDYRCVLRVPSVPGVADKEVVFAIAGDPLPPKPVREAMKTQQAQQVPGDVTQPAVPYYVVPSATGQNYIPPTYPHRVAYPATPASSTSTQQQQQETKNPIESAINALLLMALKQQSHPATPSPSSAQSEEVKLLRERIEKQDQRMMELLQEMQRQREQDELRHEVERLRAEVAKPKDSPWKDFMPALISAIPAALQVSVDKERASREFLMTITSAQSEAQKTQIELLKTIAAQPTAEDRIGKLANIVGNNMANTVGLVSTMINTVLQHQNEGKDLPPWAQILMGVIDQGGQVAQAILGRSGEMVEGGEEEEGAATAHRIEPPEDMRPALPPEATAPAAKTLRERLLERARREMAQDAMAQVREQQVAGVPQPQASQPAAAHPPKIQIRIADFDTAMQTILTLISSGGSLYEIAFRLWKHAESGVRAAKEWFTHPVEASHLVLGTLRSNGEMVVTDERIAEVAAAIQELSDYLDQDGDPEVWAKEHDVNVPLPKTVRGRRLRAVPVEQGPTEEQTVVTSSGPMVVRLHQETPASVESGTPAEEAPTEETPADTPQKEPTAPATTTHDV